MMKKINILGQDISSKIAAGEVIERPKTAPYMVMHSRRVPLTTRVSAQSQPACDLHAAPATFVL
jgi:hypothetical protein